MSPRRAVVFVYRRRWPTIAALVCAAGALWAGWILGGVLAGVFAAAVIGGLTYRYFHSLGRRY